MIKAVLFDIDGVFVDSKEYIVRMEGDILERAGYPRPSRETVLRNINVPLRDLIKMHTRASDGEVERIYDLYLSGKVKPHAELIKFNKASPVAIRRLAKSYKLGLVTNRTKLGVKRFYGLSRLRRYFKIAVGFGDYRRAKPYPDPLIVAAQRLGIEPDEAVYVGDADVDAKAAKAAGMWFIGYGRWPKHTKYSVRSFATLPRIVESVDRAASS